MDDLRWRIEQGRPIDDGEASIMELVVAAQPEADRLPMVDVLAAWRRARDHEHAFDWCRATWPTLADAQAHAAYLTTKADTNPERGEEARLFAAFVEALPAAWARGRDGGEA
jgi:hypothetical protein